MFSGPGSSVPLSPGKEEPQLVLGRDGAIRVRWGPGRGRSEGSQRGQQWEEVPGKGTRACACLATGWEGRMRTPGLAPPWAPSSSPQTK